VVTRLRDALKSSRAAVLSLETTSFIRLQADKMSYTEGNHRPNFTIDEETGDENSLRTYEEEDDHNQLPSVEEVRAMVPPHRRGVPSIKPNWFLFGFVMAFVILIGVAIGIGIGIALGEES
jgi:hypothetical protein